MGLPMVTRHGLNALIAAFLVALRDHGDGLMERVHGILDKYDRYRAQHRPESVRFSEKDWAAIRTLDPLDRAA